MNPLKLANPIYVTKGALSLAGTAVGLAGAMARGTSHALLSPLHHLTERGEERTGADHSRSAEGAGDDPNVAGPTTAAAAAAAVTDVEGAPTGPTIVPVEPHAPEEPPIDVVGEALAAEAAQERGDGPDGAGLAHEPRGASRDEEHGDAALQRAEVDEIAEETAAALEGDSEPVDHLTEPLLDPAEAKALAAEVKVMSRAADADKG
jgi:hypothetical protein